MASKTVDGTFDRIESERRTKDGPSSSSISEDGVSEGKDSDSSKPEEYEEGKCGLLFKSMYGTQDAAHFRITMRHSETHIDKLVRASHHVLAIATVGSKNT